MRLDETTATVSLENLFDTGMQVIEFSGDILNYMIAHPVYALFFAGSVVGIGLMIIRGLKKTAKH